MMKRTAFLYIAITLAATSVAMAQNIFPGTGNTGIGTTNPSGALHILEPGVPPGGLPAQANGLLLGIEDTSGYKWMQSYGGALALNPKGNNVGIGTTTPAYRLDVSGTIRGVDGSSSGVGVRGFASNTGVSFDNYGGRFEAGGGNGVGVYGIASNASQDVTNYGGYFEAAGGMARGVYANAPAINGIGVEAYGTWYGGSFSAGRNGVSGSASDTGDVTNYGGRFSAAGNTGRGVFGEAGGSSGTGVYGWARAYDFYAAGPGINYGTSSSIRWKKNIKEIDNALDIVLNIRGVYFDWDEEHGGEHDMGFIAEEVGEYIPEIVGYEEDGVYSTGIDYAAITPILVQALKELKAENQTLKQEIEKIKEAIGFESIGDAP